MTTGERITEIIGFIGTVTFEKSITSTSGINFPAGTIFNVEGAKRNQHMLRTPGYILMLREADPKAQFEKLLETHKGVFTPVQEREVTL